MASKVPYVQGYGGITKVLEKIKTASLPDRFTQDFLATTLALKGGTYKPLIPFLKRTGFLGSDGTPTSIYKRFRNSAESGRAAAEALRTGFDALYTINEFVHDSNDEELKGLIVQATGAEPSSSTVRAAFGSFKALRAFADFTSSLDAPPAPEVPEDDDQPPPPLIAPNGHPIGVGYTINLHLPATSDVAVFNAIFRSLREHLLQ